MLQLTYENGKTFRRVFTGKVQKDQDIDRLFKELREEFHDKDRWGQMLCEIWQEVQKEPKKKG